MGFFSWLDCKTREQIKGQKTKDVYILIPAALGGGHIKATRYDGYGHFDGTDIYALIAIWNCPDDCTGDIEHDREIGIEISFADEPPKYPIKVTYDSDAIYEECDPSPDDPKQGCD